MADLQQPDDLDAALDALKSPTPRVTPGEVRNLVRAEASKQGLDPNLMEHLARQESGFNHDRPSPKGAIGVMQLMPGTAKDLNVDPNDIHQNIEGGTRYFKNLLADNDGDVPKALAAYNAGPGRAAKSGPLPAETQKYVAAITGQQQPDDLDAALAGLTKSDSPAPAGNAPATPAPGSVSAYAQQKGISEDAAAAEFARYKQGNVPEGARPVLNPDTFMAQQGGQQQGGQMPLRNTEQGAGGQGGAPVQPDAAPGAPGIGPPTSDPGSEAPPLSAPNKETIQEMQAAAKSAYQPVRQRTATLNSEAQALTAEGQRLNMVNLPNGPGPLGADIQQRGTELDAAGKHIDAVRSMNAMLDPQTQLPESNAVDSYNALAGQQNAAIGVQQGIPSGTGSQQQIDEFNARLQAHQKAQADLKAAAKAHYQEHTLPLNAAVSAYNDSLRPPEGPFPVGSPQANAQAAKQPAVAPQGQTDFGDIHKMAIPGMGQMGSYAPAPAAPPNAITGKPMNRKDQATYAESRWTQAPIRIGEMDELPETNSGITGKFPIDKEATSSLLNRFERPGEDQQRKFIQSGLPQDRGAIYVNPGNDETTNQRVLRHEEIHSLLNRGSIDVHKILSDPAVRAASEPISRLVDAMSQDDAPAGNMESELPAYMGSFSTQDVIPGVTPQMRQRYVAAFTSALAKQNPAVAAKYRRMQLDTSPANPHAAPQPAAAGPDPAQTPPVAQAPGHLMGPMPTVIPGMEKLGGTPPGPPRLQIAGNPNLPEELKSRAQRLRERPWEVDAKTGRIYQEPIFGDVPVLDALSGVPDIAHGVEKLAAPVKAVLGDVGRSQLNAMGQKQPGAPSLTPELLKQAAAGIHETAAGAFKLAEPGLVGAGLLAPVATAAALVSGMTAQKGVVAGAKKIGVPDEYADVLGDIAAILAGHYGASKFRLHPTGEVGAPIEPMGPADPNNPQHFTADQWGAIPPVMSYEMGGKTYAVRNFGKFMDVRDADGKSAFSGSPEQYRDFLRDAAKKGMKPTAAPGEQAAAEPEAPVKPAKVSVKAEDPQVPPSKPDVGTGEAPVKTEAPAATEAAARAEDATVQTKDVHDFSSTQANLPDHISTPLQAFGASIPKEQLAKDGVETESHVTVRYGNPGKDPAPIQKALEGEGPITATLGKASLFHTDEGDVLKVDVESPDLHRLNGKVGDAVEHTGETFPDYKPHVTIAYLKPGEGKKYDGKDIPGVTGQQVTLNSVQFSGKDGNKTDIPLSGKAQVALEPSVKSPAGGKETDTDVVGTGEAPATTEAPTATEGTAEQAEPAVTKDADSGLKPLQAEKPDGKDADQQGEGASSTERGPGWTGDIPTSEIHVDAPRFQFKGNVGQHGVGEEFRDIKKWDPEQAGTVAVWHDPADGKTYVVNGHHRLEMAQRLQAPAVHVRYLKAKTAAEARLKGAVINISEGRGTSLDAARIFRDSGMTAETLAKTGSVSIKGNVAKEGLALSRLAQPLFEDVINGSLPAARGAVIGEGVPNHTDQKALYDLIKQRERSGKRLTNDQVEELIRLNNRTSTKTESSADQPQGSMFGAEEMTRSLLPEKAEISDYVRKQLAAEKKLFGAVGTQAAADRLAEGGNVIKAGENSQVAERANQGMLVYDKLSQSAGPIDVILDRAARSLAAGENPNEVKQRAYRDIRSRVQIQVAQLSGVPKGNAGRAGGLDQGRRLSSDGDSGSPLQARKLDGPALSKTVEPPEEAGGERLPTKLTDLLAGAQAQRVARTGAQLADTLQVNAHAAEVLRQAYTQGGGGKMLSFEGAAARPEHVRAMLKGLDAMAQSKTLKPLAQQAAARLAAELRKASKSGVLSVAIATPEAQAHEHIHFAVDGLKFDAEQVLQYGPTRLAVTRARLRGLAHGSDERVIREVMTRIASGEHGTLELDPEQGQEILHRFTRNAVPRNPQALGILKELTHADFKTAIAEAGPGDEAARGTEPGPSTPGSSGGGGPGLSRSVQEPGAPEELGEGPDVTRRISSESRSLNRLPDREPGGPAEDRDAQSRLFGESVNRQSQADAQLHDDKLLGDQLTAQMKSGMAARPAKIKPAKNRDLFDEDNGPEQTPLFSRAMTGFYSQLERVIGDKMKGPQLPSQLMAMLKNPQSGVKQDELAWTGIEAWLSDQKGKPVTKQQVLDFVKQNEVKVEEVTHGKDLERESRVQGISAKGLAALEVPPGRRTSEQIQAIQEYHHNDQQLGERPTKFAKYVTPGGENYREMLLTLPKESLGPVPKDWKVTPPSTKGPDGSVSDSYRVFDGENELIAYGDSHTNALMNGLEDSDPNFSAHYHSSHWDEPNVLAHVRLSDHTTPDGKKVLLVNEIQSDWHQEGKKNGYRSGELGENALPAGWRIQEPTGGADWRAYDRQGTIRLDGETKEALLASVRDWWGRVGKNSEGVPAAPFSKTWHELAFRRALRHAAENGYETMAWNTGAQQAARYDLSKQVKHIAWEKNDDGTYNLNAPTPDGQPGIYKEDLTPAQLKDLVGKDITDKILAGEGRARTNSPNRDWKILEGENLSVGGAGMRGFYDKILPEYANKIGKKWGAKVGTTDLDTGIDMPKVIRRALLIPVLTRENESKWAWQDANERDLSPLFDSREQAIANRPSGNWLYSDDAAEPLPGLNPRKTTAVHSISITPTMRESVMQGQPLFARVGPPTRGRGKITINQPVTTEYTPGHGHFPALLKGNLEGAARLMDVLMNSPQGSHHGMQIPKDAVPHLRADADKRAASPVNSPEVKAGFHAIAEAFAQAEQAGQGVVFHSRESTLRHELHHVLQAILTNGHPSEFVKDVRRLMSHPSGKQARKALTKWMGYPDSPSILAMEIGAHLMSGEEGWSDLGLSPEQGRQYREDYLQQMRDEYPDKADKFLDILKLDDQPSNAPGLLGPSLRHKPGSSSIAEVGATHAEAEAENGGSTPQQRRGDGSAQAGSEGLISPARSARPDRGEVGSLREAGEQRIGKDERALARGVSGSQDAVGNQQRGRNLPGDDQKERDSRDSGSRLPALRNIPAARRVTTADPEEPERNYSGLGAFKDKFVRNLSQLEKANETVHAAAVQLATSRAQSSALLRAAAPRIEAALTKDGPTWLNFRRALIESRLRGLRMRWSEMADEMEQAPDQDLKRDFGKWALHLLKNIRPEDEAHAPPESPAATAAALLEREDYDGLRAFTSEAFNRASERVARIMPEEEFDQITTNPHFDAGLATYKKLLEKPIAQNHDQNEGVFSTALGPLDAYYPLIPMTDGEVMQAKVGRSGRSVPYRKPKNIANAFATGLSDDYSPDMEAMGDRIANAFRVNNKAALMQALADSNLSRKLNRGEETPDTITLYGKEYKAASVEISKDRDIITPKGTVSMPAQHMLIPAWLEDELRPILDKRNISLSNPKGLMSRITKYTLAGPLDAVIHSANLVGTLVANTPFLGRNLAEKAAGNFPFAKRASALFQIVTTNPTSEEAAQQIQEMAKLGILPEKYGSVASAWLKSGRKYAEQTGAELSYSFAPALYGPGGIDIRARLMMYRLAKSINPQATPKEMYLFVNQLGNYTRALQGKVERGLKESGWSPFYTAGSTMVRNGIHAWTGTGPMPKKGAGLRALQAITGGAAGLIALWMLAHKKYTGQWPQQDPHAKFLAVRLNAEDRQSQWAVALYGPPSSGDAYVDIGFFSPLVKRGARALGIAGMFDAHQAGASADQLMDAAMAGALNAAVQPMMGPPAKAAWIGLTGTEPYLTALRDDRGKPMPQLMPAVKPQAPGAVGWAKQHIVPAVTSINGLFSNVAAATGLSKGIMPNADDQANHWLRMVADLAAPGLFSHASDTLTHAEFLARQRASATDADRVTIKGQITQAVRDHDKAKVRELATQALKAGTITEKDFVQSVKRANTPKDIAGFRSLPLGAALDIMEIANPEEKRRFMPSLVDKLQHAQMPIPELREALERYKQLSAGQ